MLNGQLQLSSQPPHVKFGNSACNLFWTHFSLAYFIYHDILEFSSILFVIYRDIRNARPAVTQILEIDFIATSHMHGIWWCNIARRLSRLLFTTCPTSLYSHGDLLGLAGPWKICVSNLATATNSARLDCTEVSNSYSGPRK